MVQRANRWGFTTLAEEERAEAEDAARADRPQCNFSTLDAEEEEAHHSWLKSRAPAYSCRVDGAHRPTMSEAEKEAAKEARYAMPARRLRYELLPQAAPAQYIRCEPLADFISFSEAAALLSKLTGLAFWLDGLERHCGSAERLGQLSDAPFVAEGAQLARRLAAEAVAQAEALGYDADPEVIIAVVVLNEATKQATERCQLALKMHWASRRGVKAPRYVTPGECHRRMSTFAREHLNAATIEI